MPVEGSLARRRRFQPWRLAAAGAALVGCLAFPDAPLQAQDTGSRGAAVTRLPAGYVWIDEGSRRYAFHDGRFFAWVPEEKHFVPVKAPIGAAVPAPPRGSRVTRIRGVTYHVYLGVHYKATRRNGRTVYVVAKI